MGVLMGVVLIGVVLNARRHTAEQARRHTANQVELGRDKRPEAGADRNVTLKAGAMQVKFGRDSLHVCEQPNVAVCIVGQLRGSLRSGHLNRSATLWKDLGVGCVDFFLAIGLEGRPTSLNKGTCPGNTLTDANQTIKMLQPQAWRFYRNTLLVSHDPKRQSVHDLHAWRGPCRKPADWSAHSVMCGAASDGYHINDCRHPNCTHCDSTGSHITYQYPQQRLHTCLEDVLEHETSHHQWYKWVVFQRPDFIMSPLPPLVQWDALFLSLQPAAFFCNACPPPRKERCAVDFFILAPKALLPLQKLCCL
jgi:hypothetical protein